MIFRKMTLAFALCAAPSLFATTTVEIVLKNSATSGDKVSIIGRFAGKDAGSFSPSLLLVKKASTGTMSFYGGRIPYLNAPASGADQFTLNANATANVKVVSNVNTSSLLPRWTITSCQKVSGTPTANWTHSMTGCSTSSTPGSYLQCGTYTGNSVNPNCTLPGSPTFTTSTNTQTFTAGNRVCRRAAARYTTYTASTSTVHWEIIGEPTGIDYCTCPSSGSCSTGTMRYEDDWVGASETYAKM